MDFGASVANRRIIAVTFRYSRKAPFQPRLRRLGRIAAWFAQLSMVLIMLSASYLLPTGREEPAEARRLSDGIYSGFPRVESASMIRFEDIRVRLKGIDAPDMGQMCVTRSEIEWQCGQTAADVLSEMVANGPVTCEGIVDHTGSMIIAVCHDAHATNINARLVEFGWAVAERNGYPVYAELEEIAREEHRGIWASSFEMPWDWRQLQRGK